MEDKPVYQSPVILEHPGVLSDCAKLGIKHWWDKAHEDMGVPAPKLMVLEEGMRIVAAPENYELRFVRELPDEALERIATEEDTA